MPTNQTHQPKLANRVWVVVQKERAMYLEKGMAQRGQSFFEVVSIHLPFHKIFFLKVNNLTVAQSKTFGENLLNW